MIAPASHLAWPSLGAELCDNGLSLTALPGETSDQRADRIDTALMSLFRDSGRRDAFESLYEHSRARVFEWLRWVLREQHARLDPVELLQDTFVNVYRYASSFRSEHASSFRAWVRTIAANVVRRARAMAAGPRMLVETQQTTVHEPVDWHAGPQRRVCESEERGNLRAAWLLFLRHYAEAFERLSPRDRRALVIVEVEGFSYAEASQALGVGASNMKMIMLRARRRLVAHMRVAMLGARHDDELIPRQPRLLSA